MNSKEIIREKFEKSLEHEIGRLVAHILNIKYLEKKLKEDPNYEHKEVSPQGEYRVTPGHQKIDELKRDAQDTKEEVGRIEGILALQAEEFSELWSDEAFEPTLPPEQEDKNSTEE